MLGYTDAVPVDERQKAELLDFAVELAGRAGEAIAPYFRSSLDVDNKRPDGRFDPVTEADRAGESVIREGIEREHPEHGIFGEEFGFKAGNGLTWVIDPIDGTRAFMTGMLHWGVLIGLFNGQRPIVGVMHQPVLGEFFLGDCAIAEYRCGAVRRMLSARSCESLREAVLTTTSPRLFTDPAELAGLQRLEQAAKLTKYGGDCYIYGMLAMGHVDIAMDATLNPYDIQALIPIIEGAGGVVTTVSGTDASMGGTVIASATEALHREVLATMAGGD